MPSGKSALSHRELIDKAHHQAMMQSPVSKVSRSLSSSLQDVYKEPCVLSPQSTRLLSPRSPVSPLSPETIRVFDNIAPEDSPMYHSRAQLGHHGSPMSPSLRKGSAWTRPRSADTDARQSERWRCLQAELRLKELAKQLRLTKSALMASEKRADSLVGGISPSSWSETRNRFLLSEVSPGNSFVSTTASFSNRDMSMLDKTQLASPHRDAQLESEEADLMLRPLNRNERVLNEIKREHDVCVAVEEAKLQARELASVEAKYKSAASSREISLLKEENALLRQQVHVLEATLQSRDATAEHQGTCLREVKEERQLRVCTLERELSGQRARMQDILTELHCVRDAKARVELEKAELGKTLSETRRELEKAGVAKAMVAQAYEEKMQQLGQERNIMSREVEDRTRSERLMRDKDVSVARAEARTLQSKCRDELRNSVLIQEQLDKERKERAFCESSKNEVVHLLNELNDQRSVETQRSSIDLMNLEAYAQTTQTRLRSELEDAQLQAKSLQVQLDERERQLQEAHDTAGGYMLVRDQANAQRCEALDDLRQSKALTIDLQKALSDALREKEEILKHSAQRQKMCEAERDLFQQRSFVLRSALDEVDGSRYLQMAR